MSPLALPFVPSLHSSGKDNYASNEASVHCVALMFQSALSLRPSLTMGRVDGSALTSYLQDSCLSNAKSIAQHQGEVRARLTIVESYLTAHLPVL